MEKMLDLGVPFILGMADSASYRRQRDALRLATPSADLPQLGRRTADDEAAAVAAADGEIDLVSELTDPVASATIGHTSE